MGKKLIIIGLDCASPQLVFEEFYEDLPNLKRIMENGIYNEIESTIPPITIPAWMSMFTGKDPGELGIYGFTNRQDYLYNSLSLAFSKCLKVKKIWDKFSDIGKRSIVMGVPLTYPPQSINGCMISGFLTPSYKSDYTYPKALKNELKNVVGHYIFDVEEFRTDNKKKLLKQIYQMTDNHFAIANYLAKNKEWDLFIMIEIGSDRIHHGFWSLHDKTHPKYVSSVYNSAIKDYYIYLDNCIGDFLRNIDGNYDVIIVSDHGIKPMYGGIALNEWLIEKGYLVLKEYPQTPVTINRLIKEGKVDWSKTKAWGYGGYHGKLFFNIKDREPQGTIDKKNIYTLKNQLIQELKEIKGENGESLNTKVFEPQNIYKAVNNIPPDLIIYFDDLYLRCQGTVGSKSLYTHENDVGPDDANHAQKGIFITNNKNLKVNKITDFFDAVLALYG